MSLKLIKSVLIICIVLLIGGFYFSGGREYLSFENVQSKLDHIQTLYSQKPIQILSIFMGIYILITSLSIPGSIVLTVLAGSIFGTSAGTLLVSLASTIGACLAFLMARLFLKDYIMRKFSRQFRSVNQRINEQGFYYLFTLRLVPASPYVVVNLIMGLTSMPLWTFAWITFLGMLPGTLVYVYAGRKFSELESISGIMSIPILLSLLFLGFMPYIWKLLIKLIRQPKKIF